MQGDRVGSQCLQRLPDAHSLFCPTLSNPLLLFREKITASPLLALAGRRGCHALTPARGGAGQRGVVVPQPARQGPRRPWGQPFTEPPVRSCRTGGVASAGGHRGARPPELGAGRGGDGIWWGFDSWRDGRTGCRAPTGRSAGGQRRGQRRGPQARRQQPGFQDFPPFCGTPGYSSCGVVFFL